MEMFSSFKPFLRAFTGFDGTTISCHTDIWLHWLKNKNILALAHVNARNQQVKADVINLYEIDLIAIKESLASIKKSEICLPSFKDVLVEAYSVNVTQCVVKSVLCRSNMIFYLVSHLISNDCFAETRFNKLMKDVECDNHLVGILWLK